jgi:hypothetical protein
MLRSCGYYSIYKHSKYDILQNELYIRNIILNQEKAKRGTIELIYKILLQRIINNDCLLWV